MKRLGANINQECIYKVRNDRIKPREYELCGTIQGLLPQEEVSRVTEMMGEAHGALMGVQNPESCWR